MAEPGLDPFAAWRDWLSQSERQWNTFLNDAMATDEFGQSVGRFMDVYLGMQRSMNDMMGRYLTTLNMPTRADVLALANRLTDIEGRLGELEDALRQVSVATGESEAEGPIARPPRTKKPKMD